MELTFLAIKPDGVQRGLVGEIIQRFETKGFTLVGLKFMDVSKELADSHYDIHRERPFFDSLVEFLTSGPVVAMVMAMVMVKVMGMGMGMVMARVPPRLVPCPRGLCRPSRPE